MNLFNYILGYICIRISLDLFYKVVYYHQDEMMPITCIWINYPNDIQPPHREKPR
jgi:hypothetical protein